MNGLEHGNLVANVGAGGQPHGTRQFGGNVRQDVAVQVGRDDHIEPVWPGGQARGANVHDHVLGLYAGVLLRHLIEHPMEQPIGHLHDVVLGHAGDLLAAVGTRVLEGVAHDFFAAGAGDELEALEHLVGLAVLDARVEVFLVLPHDHQVHLGVQRLHVGRVAHAGAHVGVEAQRLSDGDVQALEAATLGRGDGGLEEHLGAAQAFPRVGSNARAVARKVLLLANVYEFGRQRCASGLEHAQRRFHDFGADAVAHGYGDGYCLCHV